MVSCDQISYPKECIFDTYVYEPPTLFRRHVFQQLKVAVFLESDLPYFSTKFRKIIIKFFFYELDQHPTPQNVDHMIDQKITYCIL